MRILNVFGFFSIFCINFNRSDALNAQSDLDIVKRECNSLENSSAILRLRKYLFCDYDSDVNSNHPKSTKIFLSIMPKFINFNEDKLSLQCWMAVAWTDSRLNWKPSDYDDVTFIHTRSWRLWTPTLYVNNGVDISDQYELPITECLIYNTSLVSCVFAVTFVSKCNTDLTYWPYDKHKCRVTLVSWENEEEKIDLTLTKTGINMNDYINDTIWDFKFINSTKELEIHEYCPNNTCSKINYDFLLIRHYSKYYTSIVVPAITLVLLTLTVLCLDLKSIERMTIASVNFVCHLLCTYFVHWSLPYNGVNTPHILLFYRESLALATFAIILTALLRKLENMSTEVPNWISFTTTLVLNNKAGRFLILKNDKSKMIDGDIVTEENSDGSKLEPCTNESLWKHFTAIVDELSFFCVIFTYVIILIVLVPTY